MRIAREESPIEDRAVVGLGLLLSDEPLRAWLAERGEVLERRCYLRYKPGTSCVAALRLASGTAFVLAVAASVQPKLDKLLAGTDPKDVLAHDPERLVVLASLRADRDLPALCDLERRVTRLLAGTVNPQPHTMVYKPQRRWVGLVSSAGRVPVVLRAYRRSRSVQASERVRMARHAAGAFRVPRLLARSRRSALLAVEFLPGTSLAKRLHLDASATELAATGAAMARMHRRDVPNLPVALVSEPRDTAALTAALAPHLSQRVADLVDRLHRTSPRGPTALCHGDFSCDQVVIDQQGALGLLDWDRAGRGDPAADIASAIAAGLDDSAAAELLAGYDRVRPVPRSLPWHLANAHFRRLAEPFRLASPSWPAELEQGVARLEAIMP